MTTVRERIEQFCTAYYLGDAHTFCDPDTGDMVSATYEVQAFANALINGPLMDDADEVDARIAEAVAGERERCAQVAYNYGGCAVERGGPLYAYDFASGSYFEVSRRERIQTTEGGRIAAAIRGGDHDG